MAARVHKKSRKNGLLAQKRINTNIASQLEDKFAKMRLTPSQDVVKDQRTRHEFYKEIGIGPQLPPVLYNGVKRVVESLEQLEKDADDMAAQGKLAVAEAHIKVLARSYREDLPRGWKYIRKSYAGIDRPSVKINKYNDYMVWIRSDPCP